MDIPHIYHTQFEEELKCPNCNWGGSVFYSVTAEVKKDPDDSDRSTGLCSSCFMETLIEAQESG